MSADVKILDQNAVPSSAIQPQGSLGKDVSSVAGISELTPAGSGVKHNLDEELKGIGIEEKKDHLELDSEHEELGIKHAGASVPILNNSLNSSEGAKLKEKVTENLKAGQDDDSEKCLGKLIKKVEDVENWKAKNK